MDTRTPDRLTLLAFTLTVLFAGNNSIAVKYSNTELPPFFGAAIRFGIAALIFIILIPAFHLKLPRGRNLMGAILYGILGTGLNFALIYWALEYIPAGLSMVILALVPLLTFLFAWAFGQESFRWEAILGASLALFGIGIIAWDQVTANVPILPIFAVLGGAICFAGSTVLIKSFPQSHPITTNAVALISGSILLFAFSILGKETPALPSLPQTWIALTYLVIFGTVVTFGLSLYVIKNWTASASSYSFVLMPIVTVIMGAWLINESITVPFLAGAVFVLSGAYIGSIANIEQWKCYLMGLFSHWKTPAPECK